MRAFFLRTLGCIATTASAHNGAAWVVWRDGPRLDILDSVVMIR